MFKLLRCLEHEINYGIISAAVTIIHQQTSFLCECGGGVEENTRLGRSVLNLRCLYQSLSTLFFERGFLIGQGHVIQSGLAAPQNLRYPPASTSSVLELQALTITTGC